MKIFNTHIPTGQLADLIDGKHILPANLSRHLSDCAHCSREFAVLEKAVGLMRRDDSADAPAAALEFARNIFRARQKFAPSVETRTQKILATLKIDLAAFSPVCGERSSAGSSEERQMLFAAGDYDLDLRLREMETGYAVRGQVLGEGAGKCAVRLENADFALAAPVDEAGGFFFANVPSVDGLQVSLVLAE